MPGTFKTEAVVLRSIRFSEADCVLHLYTLERGRVGAIAKGVRKTKSRFGARLEPFSHVELMLHEGRGSSARCAAPTFCAPTGGRIDGYRMAVGHIGLEAMLRLFVEQDANAPAFNALTRFLDLLDDVGAALPAQLALDPLVLSFQLKLLWLSGYLPHSPGAPRAGRRSRSSASRHRPEEASARNAARARSPCPRRASKRSAASSSARWRRRLLPTLTARGLRECLDMIESSYEYHGGFRAGTLAQRA